MDTSDRSARIRVLVAEQATRRGARVGVLDVCEAAVAALPVQGAGLSAMSWTPTDNHPLCSTDEVSERLEELQLTLGEGPCLDAFTLGTAVLAADILADEALSRWPVFAPAAAEAGAGAVFAFPLHIGATRSGVLDFYTLAPGDLPPELIADAAVFAETAAVILLEHPFGGRKPPTTPVGDTPARDSADLGAYRAEIDQATGMLTEQLGVRTEEAFARLRAHAYVHGRRLADVAADVVARLLRFPSDSAQARDQDRTDDDT